MRRMIAFPCDGDTLVGTLDEGGGGTGVLIVSGGNEIRIGAHRGMAMLAQRLAARGVPVLRFDRRGIGDSTGSNTGFEGSADDIAAAVSAFRRAVPHLTRIVGFGNCDAASALALCHAAAGVDALVLANPWIIEGHDDLPPPAAIRARYAQRLRDPKEWLRLLRGGVDLGKLTRGLVHSLRKPDPAPQALAARIGAALAASEVPVTVLLARRDNTAVAFRATWDSPTFAGARNRITLNECDTASHSFARAEDAMWLEERVTEAAG